VEEEAAPVDAIDTRDVRALTFDCYGTLVDWETGILTTLRRVLAAHQLERPDDELLELFGRLESRIQATAFGRYRDVLAAVMSAMANELGFGPSADERIALAEELGTWPVFPDTREALTRLGSRFRLAIVSNVDDALFSQTQDAIGVRFDAVVTAEQVESYKPDPAHFLEVLRRLELDRHEVIHVAQSLFHDIAPASALGWRTIWVRRGATSESTGATPPAQATPDHTVDDLAAAADLLLG
jgi:2-haloacid dehalogenase